MNRCKDLFAEAADLAPAERATLLDRACSDDPELRCEVERLLTAFDGAGDFLETPAVDRREIRGRFDHPGARVGPYVLREPLGEGGMGIVWKADQAAPVRREVAIKLLKSGAESRQVLARFETERRALERMEHPNVARVLDAGVTDLGRPYVVMELVRGTSITTFCDARRLSVLERLQLFVPVCGAVQHAHAKGIIHRDLKPSNVLVAADGLAPVPKVIDFGIARAVDRPADETNHTEHLLLLGTPSYVSPEQAIAGVDVDTRTDVYSLGAVLYELLCGMPPFDPHGLTRLPADELLRRLRDDDPPRPSRRVASSEDAAAIADARGMTPAALGRLLAGDLDRIVMKALEKSPTRRYETAASLAEDVGRFLRHEPVAATRPSASYHALKFARRHRTGLFAGTLVALSLVAGTAVSTWQAVRATENERLLRRQNYISDLNLADEALRNDDPRRMAELLARHVPGEGQRDLRDFAWHYLRRHCTAPGGPIDRFDGPALFACLSPDGSTLAASGADGTIRLYDARTSKRSAVLGAGQGEVNGLAFSPDGASLASAGDDGTVKIWDFATRRERLTIPVFGRQAFQVAYAQAGGEWLLAVCGNDPVIKLFDPESGEPRGELAGHAGEVEGIAVSADGRLAAATSDGVPCVWDLATRKPSASGPDIVNLHLMCAAFSPDGRYVAFGTSRPFYLLWDLRSADPPRAYPVNAHRPGEGEGVQALAFDRSGRMLLTADRGGVVRFSMLADDGRPRVDLTDGRFPRWAAHDDRVYAVALTGDAQQVVTVGREGALSVWRPFAAADAWSVKADLGEIKDVAVGPRGVVAVAGDRGVGRWHVEAGLVERFPETTGEMFISVAQSVDGRIVVAGSRDGRYAAWSVGDGSSRLLWNRRFDDRPSVELIRISSDGRFAAMLVNPADSQPKRVCLIDLAAGRTLDGRDVAGAFGLAFSPDGSTVAVDREDDVLLLEVPTWEIRRTLDGHHQSVGGIAFSPDGRLLATGSGDRRVILWDAATGTQLDEWIAHGGAIGSVAFSPDGRLLLTTGADMVPKLWDVATRRLLLRLPQLDHEHWPMQFVPDGRLVVGRDVAAGLYVFDGRAGDEPLRWPPGGAAAAGAGEPIPPIHYDTE